MNNKPKQPVVRPSTLPEVVKPLSETDPAYSSLPLPSNFQWYSFKQLSVRPLRVPEIKKIWAAHVSDSLRAFIEAINPAMDQDLFDLTVGDLYAVMFWLRLNSYTKAQYSVQWSCNHKDHIKKVMEGPKKAKKGEGVDHSWTPESLANTHIVQSTSVEEVQMRPLEEIAEFMKSMDLVQKGIAFYPSTVRDMVEIAEMSREPEFDAGDDYLCRYATYLDRRHGATLQDRATFMMTDPRFTPDDTIQMNTMIDYLTHGVRESIKLPCKKCSASNSVAIPIDARTFLPSLHRDRNPGA